MFNKDYENIWDDSTAPESEGAKGDGNNTSGNSQPSGSMAISMLDHDEMKQSIRTVGNETGPMQNEHHVHQTRYSPAKYPWTVG